MTNSNKRNVLKNSSSTLSFYLFLLVLFPYASLKVYLFKPCSHACLRQVFAISTRETRVCMTGWSVWALSLSRPTVYSGICTVLLRTGGRHVNIPARPRLSTTTWVNITNPVAKLKCIQHLNMLWVRKKSLFCESAAGSLCVGSLAADSVLDWTDCDPDVWHSFCVLLESP